MKKRNTLKAWLAPAAGMLLAGLIGGNAYAQDYATSLVIYEDRKEQMNPTIEGFKKYFHDKTGKDLKVTSFSQSGGQLAATIALEAQANAVKADVIMTSPASLRTMENNAPGLFDKYIPSTFTESAVDPAIRDAAKDFPGLIYDVNPYAIIYNTSKVPVNEVPKSWTDLLDPKWTDKIGMGDVEQTTGSRAPLWFLVKYMGDKGGAPFGWDYYEKLGALRPRLFDSHNTLVDTIATGELVIGISSYSTAYRAVQKGQPIALVLPKEGAGSEPTSVAIVKQRSPDVLNTARMFMDYCQSKEGQQLLFNGIGALPIRSDVDLGKAPFPFDVNSPTLLPDDPKWISDNSDDSVTKFREYIK